MASINPFANGLGEEPALPIYKEFTVKSRASSALSQSGAQVNEC